MKRSEFIDLVTRSRSDETAAEFEDRVDDQARRLTETLEAGHLESPDFGIGMELEVYAVDDEGTLTRLPKSVFEADCAKELGLHNAELNTSPDTLTEAGIEAQADKLRASYESTQAAASEEDCEIVLDAMWSVPPAEGTQSYFGDVDREDGVLIANNMAHSPRYSAIDTEILDKCGGSVSISVPGADVSFPTILVESLTSSIQPHLQIPDTETFPEAYNAAIATLGPILALSTNSPLLPVDCYDVNDPESLLDDTHHELRIDVFEQSINGAWEKVKFPDKIDSTTDVIDLLVDDPTVAPFLREWLEDGPRETFADDFWELDHKRGTYWRWLRAVTGGQPVGDGDEQSLRIEYRPIPTQPTVDDIIGLQCLVTGVIRGLLLTDHPAKTLDQSTAEAAFYSAVRNGLDADLAWITADGEETTDSGKIYAELFEIARHGLREQGVSDDTIDRYLDPIEARWDRQLTPSQWKLDQVRAGLTSGLTFPEAVREMQQEYAARSSTGTPFAEWDKETVQSR
ncbi:hypothetical protein halTADL_2799 [Halohasta litchfieldiae]|jgi:hypothetical protein|uniref:Gamma-glutamyl:cysteine ligase YbdK, ATP-grasp superfamily n=1 Tax=Halohasta litchfieldiae TaxID=1073996 RepID=A0A1H6W7K8_9EURY|nr:hypothetical protein [Halohasta litchfieldiae]ATW89513.1 hypothetical protein halTADL_2799 [Halohasta litchfieldiae]SEJ11224.1 hypothetical protein SAMN05444271_12211 [Halohasta litchfieldiae]